MHNATTLLSLCLVLSWSAVADAQAPVEDTDTLLSDELGLLEDLDLDELIGLEVVRVTAQKRLEDLQDVPTSVAALPGDRVSNLRTSGQDIRFLSGRVPSLYLESSFGRSFPRLYMRGLGNPDFDLNASQPVSVLLDGVVLENPTLKGFPIFDMDRVEVLRGPQGTLFGRNTPAGIVKLESRRPTFESEGYGRATYGSFNFIGLEGAANAPVIDDLFAVRASVLYERQSDFVDNALPNANRDGVGGFSDLAARLQLRLTPSENLDILVNGHVRRLDGTARLFRANIIEPGTENFTDDYSRGQVQHDGQNEQKATQYGFLANISYDFGPVVLASITGFEAIDLFSRGDIDGGYGAAFAPPSGPGNIPFPSESADAIPALAQITEELRLASDDWNLFNFQAGVFIFREALTIESRSYNTLAGSQLDGFATQTQDTTAWAAFTSAWVDVVEGLRLTGGVRYSSDAKDFTAERTMSPIGAENISLTEDVAADFVSWDASLIWEAIDDVSIYTRASSSFRAPSIQGRILFGDEISTASAEDVLSFEGGIKSLLWDGRVRANLSGYFFNLNDQQLTAVGGTANFNRLINADQSRGFGAELDLEAAPIHGLVFGLGASYNNTRIRDPDLAIAPCGSGCNVLDPAGPVDGTVLIDGNPLPHAPEWIVNVSARYEHEIDDANAIFAFTNWSYRSRVHFFLYQSTEFTDAMMILGDLRLGYRRDGGVFEVSTFVSNLLNDDSRTGGIDFNNLTGFVNNPRTFGLELIMRL